MTRLFIFGVFGAAKKALQKNVLYLQKLYRVYNYKVMVFGMLWPAAS
jgi:hypothetical protein